MDPINTLMNKHRLIEKMLGAMAGYMEGLARTGTADRADLARFVDFLAGYADAVHHGKEEDLLFDAMVRSGFSATSGPVAAMLADHTQNRQYTQALRTAALREGAAWTEAEIQEVIGTAGAYTYLLSAHIQKEDGILYPMAMQQLSDDVKQELWQQFGNKASDEAVRAEVARLTALADELIARYGNAM